MAIPSLQTSFSSTPSSSSHSRRAPLPPLSPSAEASVQVVVRVRPLNDREKKHGTLPVISASTSDKTVTVIKGSGSRQAKTTFKFDNVFTSFSTQEDVFEATLQPIIKDVLNGYESTVFAYGQTGTGKTHTMEGDLSNSQEHGVIPRSAAAIFDALEKDPDYVSSTVYCSLLEIYNEELSDLLVERSEKRGNSLAAKPPKLTIMEGEKGPFCRGLSESKVTSAEDLLGLMQRAHQQRQTGETDMNKESSRSHCIFTLRVEAKRQLIDGSVLAVGGKLHCVDLAGSECAKACGNAGKHQAARERERMNINRSLLTLGRVVKLLKENCEKSSGSGTVRIPYRDSKLTRILQESLGGRCKTCLIATISPSVTAIEESMSTLNYAQTANGIVNKPITTSLLSVGGLDNNNNKTPKGEESAGSVEHWHEMECRLEYMKSQVDEAQQALARKHIQHQEFLERAEKAELALELVERKFEKAVHDISVLEKKVESLTSQLDATEKLLRETQAVLGATQRTEESLTEEGMALLRVLKTTISDGDRLHRALLEKRKEDLDRKAATRDYQTAQTKLLSELLNHLEGIGKVQTDYRQKLETANETDRSSQLELLKQHSAVVEAMTKDCLSDLESLRASSRERVLPKLRTLTSSSKEKMNALLKDSEQGEERLRSQCRTVLETLDENRAQIQRMEDSYDVSSKEVLEVLVTHLESARESLTATVEGVSEALEKATAERTRRRERMGESIAGLKGRCEQSIESVELLSNSHTETLRTTLQRIPDGKENRSQILRLTSDLDGFLGSRKEDYVQNLERQLKILTKQHEALISSHQKQQQLNKSLVSNIMKGIGSVIATEIKTVDEFQTQSYDSLIAGNERSKSCNEELNTSTLDTFVHLEATNARLKNDIRETFDEQDQLYTVLETETSEFDANMKSATKTLREPIHKYCIESTDALEKAIVEDRDTTEETIEMTKTLVDKATSQLVSGIQEGVGKGIYALQASNKEGFKYFREQVITPVQSEVVDSIQAHQIEVNASLRDNLAVLEKGLHEGEHAVVEEVNKGLEIASNAEQRLQIGANERFTDSIHKHEDHITGSHWLETTVEAQEQCVNNEVTKTAGLLSTSTDHLGEFTRDVIRLEEETREVEERAVPAYSDVLSKTQSREVILREAGLYGDDDETVTDENMQENLLPSKSKASEKRLSSSQPLMDRSGSINHSENSTATISISPPLKRVAERSKLKHPTGRGNKRMRTRTRN